MVTDSSTGKPNVPPYKKYATARVVILSACMQNNIHMFLLAG